MNLPLKIARRYLFAKKSTNAINIISGISVLGICIGTAALVLVLSVFNGFEELLLGLFSKFNPDVKIAPIEGKTFSPDSSQIAQLYALPGVEYVSQTIEEVAFFEYGDHQDFGVLKGVDSNFHRLNRIDTSMFEGSYGFTEGERNLAVLGGGMSNKLQVNLDDPFEVLKIFMAKQETGGELEQPFKRRLAYPAGSFRIQQDFDNQYVLVSLGFARELLEAEDAELSALEVRLRPKADQTQTLSGIRQIFGEAFSVKDRYQQDEAFLKLMNVEKWLSFAILSLTLILVAFNMIGSLWMIVLEKKSDIGILKSMGATDNSIRNIFLFEGLLLCLFGLGIGFVIALILYVLQKTIGIVPIPDGFIVKSYPIDMRFTDLLAVTGIVLLIGLLASVPAALRSKQVPALMREE